MYSKCFRSAPLPLTSNPGRSAKVVGNLQDYCTFSPDIRRMNKEYAELRRLTDLYTDIQNRWGIYLQLSNSTYQIDTDKMKRALREQVRHEMTAALGGLLTEGVCYDMYIQIHVL